MKKYYYVLALWIFFGCKPTTKNEPLSDASGKYAGVRSGSDLIGVPTPTGSKPFSENIEVSVIKNGENYVIMGFDTLDLTVPVSEQLGFNIPVDKNSNRALSAFIKFSGDSLEIRGNWKYTYIEGGYNNASINVRNFRFVGYKTQL
ncbi:hypothetical protein L0657_23750 [Dyadobacter sp. CY345]|uniref:hypothetical protein n=1 Tax=Dyadobacter sp. CY345 TaxID=2909335 RepID=UPI001F49181C|nr:hypothetical protein [Dyadobacter sp. CY345]MCF2446988.1 hypothetical protein [Dyadobacter sp. CY345]